MLIDFHAHIFADALAPRARAVLMENSHGAYTHCTDMTLGGLTAYMDAHGVDKSVVLPIVTKQRQTETINKWAASINDGEKIVAFGGIFPHTDDYKRDIDLVVSLGLKGIKLHPEYQEFVADEKELFPVYEYRPGQGAYHRVARGLRSHRHSAVQERPVHVRAHSRCLPRLRG